MKYCAIIVLFFLTLQSKSQNDFSQLKGVWIVDSIINKRTNEVTSGKYGIQGEYLKFDFRTKSALLIANSPIDCGQEVPIIISKNEIKIDPQGIYPQQMLKMDASLPTLSILSESTYVIKQLNAKSLKLETCGTKDTIAYYLTRPVKQDKPVISIVFPFILIEHKVSGLEWEGAQSNFPMGAYNKEFPVYENYYSLAYHISHSVNLSNINLEENIPSKEVTLKFIINENGKAEEIKIEDGIDKSIDITILKLIEKSRWTIINDVSKCLITMKIVFIKRN